MQIYKITNLINGKIYIGKDTTNDKNYYGSGLLIKRAIKKFGIENFKKEILDECFTNEELKKKEVFWIDKLNSTDLEKGYNISKGGDGGDVITNHPNKEKIIEKISEFMKKRIFTEEHKKNLSKNHHSTKHKKGKTYLELYGPEKAQEYVNKLKQSRQKYKTEKERLGDKYESYINEVRKRFYESNPMKEKKYIWYHNPITGKQTRVAENEPIPEGYIKGRK